MKRNYIRIHRNILASWVFADPQSLYVLLYLILQADPETGQVRASQREMANYLRMPRFNIRTALAKLSEAATIKVIKAAHKKDVITICNYAHYQGLSTNTPPTIKHTLKERKEKEKKNLPPHPLIEEKKEEKKERPHGVDNFSSEKLTLSIGDASLSTKKREAKQTLDERRQAFWNKCRAFIGNYTEEMVKQFFLHWSETNEQQPDKMLFEKQKTFQISLRLAKWKHNGEVFGEDRTAHRRKQPATTQYTTLNAKETATMESLIDHQQQREAQWKERSRKAVTYEEYQRMKAEGKVK